MLVIGKSLTRSCGCLMEQTGLCKATTLCSGALSSSTSRHRGRTGACLAPLQARRQAVRVLGSNPASSGLTEGTFGWQLRGRGTGPPTSTRSTLLPSRKQCAHCCWQRGTAQRARRSGRQQRTRAAPGLCAAFAVTARRPWLRFLGCQCQSCCASSAWPPTRSPPGCSAREWQRAEQQAALLSAPLAPWTQAPGVACLPLVSLSRLLCCF